MSSESVESKNSDEGGGGNPPILNAPRIVVLLILVFVSIHLLRQVITGDWEQWVSIAFAFSPARLAPPPELARVMLPGGEGAKYWTFFSHALLHVDWLHLAINSLWMLAFGSVVARWMGAGRFIAFSFLCAAGGALLSQVVYWGTLSFMIGASGAISGQMAGAVRLMFAQGGRLSLFNAGHRHASPLPLAGILTHRRARMFIVVWMIINAIFGFVGIGAGADVGRIAWEAHVGGFVAGLLLLGLFERRNMS